MNLNEKLEAATKNYEAYRARLDKARADYEGPQKEYAETKANLAALTLQIKENEALLAESKPKLSKELRRSNGERTEAVKNLLSDRRNTEELVDELRVIVTEIENRIASIRATISPLAESYESIYQSAGELWAQVNAYRVLADCAPRLCEALVTTPQLRFAAVPGLLGEGKSFSSKDFILQEISSLLESQNWNEKPYSADLGEFDLGAFEKKQILSPIGRQRILRNLQQTEAV